MIGLFLKNASDVVYVAFPFGPNKNSFIQADSYSEGQLIDSERSLFRIKLPEALAYIKDFAYALCYTLRYAYRADVLICGDNLLSFAAALAAPVALTRSVVYYMIDYTPVRYQNRIMNSNISLWIVLQHTWWTGSGLWQKR